MCETTNERGRRMVDRQRIEEWKRRFELTDDQAKVLLNDKLTTVEAGFVTGKTDEAIRKAIKTERLPAICFTVGTRTYYHIETETLMAWWGGDLQRVR